MQSRSLCPFNPKSFFPVEVRTERANKSIGRRANAFHAHALLALRLSLTPLCSCISALCTGWVATQHKDSGTTSAFARQTATFFSLVRAAKHGITLAMKVVNFRNIHSCFRAVTTRSVLAFTKSPDEFKSSAAESESGGVSGRLGLLSKSIPRTVWRSWISFRCLSEAEDSG